MRVLIGCEFSGVVRRAFAARGHFAVSVDLLPAEDGPSNWGTRDYSRGWHYQGDLLDFIFGDATGLMQTGFDLAIFHPECTFLCNSGVRWMFQGGSSKNPPDYARKEKFLDAAHFFVRCGQAPIKRIARENPIPHRYAKQWIGNYSHTLQPWQHGHREMKATCLWLTNLPDLKPSNIVGPPPKDPEKRKHWARVHRASPGPDRWKERSRTLPGIAAAMAEQWGCLG